MNAEALIGTVLGTCTLQKLIGQGGMGAVYLAQQSRPRRQVSVKVLLPMHPLAPNQRAAFLERFRRETDVIASLEHPHIMPVHEYGERDGLAYLVMPYINGGTLGDEMEREGQMPLEKMVYYLDQMAAALDFAHQHGIIHRDIKPANILLRREGHLLLTDFGLVKIVADQQQGRPRLTGVGVPLGTPDYMAPEQVIGGDVDQRADLYSLAVIIYQMVTGTLPFRGEMPMQVAMQHLNIPPQSPSTLRPDFPLSAEQVLLKALAKRPIERYTHVMDFASALRLALVNSGITLPDPRGSLATSAMTAVRLYTPRSLFDPMWHANKKKELKKPAKEVPVAGGGHRNDIVGKTSMTLPSLTGFLPPEEKEAVPAKKRSSTMSAQNQNTPIPPIRPGLGLKTHLRRPNDEPQQAQPQQPAPVEANAPFVPPAPPFARKGLFKPAAPAPMENAPTATTQYNVAPHISHGGVGSPFQPQNPATASTDAIKFPAPMPWPGAPTFGAPAEVPQSNFPPAVPQSNFPAGGPTNTNLPTGMLPNAQLPNGALPPQAGMGQTMTLPFAPMGSTVTKAGGVTRQLTSSLRLDGEAPTNGATGVMKLAQPTKIVQVPVAGQPGKYVTGFLPVLEAKEPTLPDPIAKKVEALDKVMKGQLKKVALILAVLVILIGSVSFFITQNGKSLTGKQKWQGSQAAATATAQENSNSNIIMIDALTNNIHNWPEGPREGQNRFFKNGAYHIFNNSDKGAALALLPEQVMPKSFAYSVTFSQLKGDTKSTINQIGLIFHYSEVKKKGKTITTFYCFQVANADEGGYQFLKYDSSKADDPWSTVWPKDPKAFGKEYHFGNGKKNTFKVMVKDTHFTFTVNGKEVAKVQDKALKPGLIGMMVNLKGTEVAFSNLSLIKL